MGYADQGKSAYEYWNRDSNEIIICDKNLDLELTESAQTQLGEDYLNNLDQFDLIVRTPSLHPKDIVAANSETPDILKKVTSNTNEFFKVCPTKNIIGVTGTKGKGTTSALIAKMLEASGHKVHLGGNIGTPPLELLKNGIQPDDWVMLELANFQLIDLKYSPHIAVCLMVEPEHMDWHDAYEEYLSAKKQLFTHQTKNDTAIYYAKNNDSLVIAQAGSGKLIPYFEIPGSVVEKGMVRINDAEICETAEIKLLGKHNLQNVCAAVTTVWQVTQNVEAIKAVLSSFKGLEHRLEFVREVGGVKYYDDSFGTTPSTAKVAIEAFSAPKVVILGGSDKGADYEKLSTAVVEENVRNVVIIGRTGAAIESALKNAGYTNIVKGGRTMKEIVEAAQAAAKPGDIVLLSTACASFDMFKNYKDRGEQFKKAVSALT